MARIDTVAVGEALGERAHTPTNVSLFLYNASIWNPHRIHYDERYARETEGHPGLVIDGPLQGDWLYQTVLEWLGDDGVVEQLEYTNRRAAYLGETLTSGGTVVEVDRAAGTATVELHVTNAAGEVTTPGRAVVKFGDSLPIS